MPYTLVTGKTEADYEKIFIETYCGANTRILTVEGIHVKFFPDMFKHAFYESCNWKKKDKSLFSLQRAERILWIKDALSDVNAIQKVGWDKKKKQNDNSHRVTIVVQDYVVIIKLFSNGTAKFVTAYKADNSITKILNMPDWKGYP